VWVKNFIPPEVFLNGNFSQRLRFFKQNFTCLLYVHIYTKLQNCIQLSLNLTKLCHIKRNNSVNFHFSRRIYSMNFYCLTINNGLKHTIYYSFWNSKQSSVKIFLYKVHIVCSKCPPPAEVHAFRLLWKSLVASLIVVCGKSSQICCSALFIARQLTDARYWYSNFCLSVRPSVTFRY